MRSFAPVACLCLFALFSAPGAVAAAAAVEPIWPCGPHDPVDPVGNCVCYFWYGKIVIDPYWTTIAMLTGMACPT